jgi:hypothetical protein
MGEAARTKEDGAEIKRRHYADKEKDDVPSRSKENCRSAACTMGKNQSEECSEGKLTKTEIINGKKRRRTELSIIIFTSQRSRRTTATITCTLLRITIPSRRRRGRWENASALQAHANNCNR